MTIEASSAAAAPNVAGALRRKRMRTEITGLVAAAALVLLETGAQAVTLHDGDVIMLNRRWLPWFNEVLHFDVGTATRTQISSRGLLADPLQVVVHPGGRLYVADETNGILQIDPATGAQSIAVPRTEIEGSIMGMVVEPAGTLLLSVYLPGRSPSARILRVSPQGGAASTLTEGGMLTWPGDLAVSGDDVWVYEASKAPGAEGTGSLVRISASSGAQTGRVTSALFGGGGGLDADASGIVYLSWRGATNSGYGGRVTQTDPVTGSTSQIVAQNALDGVAVSAFGSVYYSYESISSSGTQGFVTRLGGGWGGSDVFGPMHVVRGLEITPATAESWGGLKRRYR